MNIFAVLVLLLFIFGLPVSWFISEFKGKRSLRCVLGILAILSCFAVAFLAGMLSRLNYNAWYGSATKFLIDSSIVAIEQGKIQHVVNCWKKLQGKYYPTYENKAHYDNLVNETVEMIKEKPAN